MMQVEIASNSVRAGKLVRTLLRDSHFTTTCADSVFYKPATSAAGEKNLLAPCSSWATISTGGSHNDSGGQNHGAGDCLASRVPMANAYCEEGKAPIQQVGTAIDARSSVAGRPRESAQRGVGRVAPQNCQSPHNISYVSLGICVLFLRVSWPTVAYPNAIPQTTFLWLNRQQQDERRGGTT